MSSIELGTQPDGMPPVKLEARLNDDPSPVATAYLFRGVGPDAAYFEQSRQRWFAGERVTPVGLTIGTVVVRSEVREALRDKLGEVGNFTTLHDEWNDLDIAEELLGVYANVTRLIHVLVRRAVLMDAALRGFGSPIVDGWQTTGGTHTPFIGRHVDYRDGRSPILRYVASAIGPSTVLDIDPISIGDVGASGVVERAGQVIAGNSGAGAGHANITLFEGHTPHEEPMDESARLLTTLDIA